jgi:hypothetical protein
MKWTREHIECVVYWMRHIGLHPNLGDLNLSGLDLSDLDLRLASLSRSILVGSDLRGANLRQAEMRQCDLTLARMQNARLYHADLRQARLVKTNLMNSNLCYADLRAAHVEGAWMLETTMYGAVLHQTRFVECRMVGVVIADYNAGDMLTALGEDALGVECALDRLAEFGVHTWVWHRRAMGEGEFVDPPGWATNSPSSLLRWGFPADDAISD